MCFSISWGWQGFQMQSGGGGQIVWYDAKTGFLVVSMPAFFAMFNVYEHFFDPGYCYLVRMSYCTVILVILNWTVMIKWKEL